MHSGSSLFKSRPLRVLAIVAVIVVLLLTTLSILLQRHEKNTPQGHTDRITLAAPATAGSPDTDDGVLITHLEMTGASPEKTGLTVSLTDMKGRPLPVDDSYGVQLAALNLNTGETLDDHEMEPDHVANTPTFVTDDPGLEDDGWWRFTTTVSRPDGDPVASSYYVLLPDPNLAGFSAPPAPETDPEAEEALNEALAHMSQWTSVRTWEWLSGGNDSLIMSRRSLTTTAANNQPDSFQSDMLFAGGFERKDEAVPPPAPSTNHRSDVTIGEEAWSRDAEGDVESKSPTRYRPIERFPETYTGAISIQTGIEDEVEGRPARIITFHVPEQPTQSEAWFAFWVDAESGDILKLTMLARNHYMLWLYSDINDDFIIEPPEGATPPSTPEASPIASPAA